MMCRSPRISLWTLAASLSIMFATPVVAQTRWAVYDPFQGLPNAASYWIYGISGSGYWVGSAPKASGFGSDPFFGKGQDPGIVRLALPSPGASGLANAVADSGAIVGLIGGSAYYWADHHSQPRALQSTAGTPASQIYALSANGIGVGDTIAESGAQAPAMWWLNSPSSVAQISKSGGIAYDVNEQGLIVGQRWSPPGSAFSYSIPQGAYTSLSTPPGVSWWPYGVNNNGVMVGYGMDAAGLWRSFIRQTNGVFSEMVSPIPNSSVQTWDINDSGVAIGRIQRSTGDAGFIYSNGQVLLLDSARVSGLNGCLVVDPRDISSDGVIVTRIKCGSVQRSVLLFPS